MSDNLKNKIDDCVKEGLFRTRTEMIKHCVNAYLEDKYQQGAWKEYQSRNA